MKNHFYAFGSLCRGETDSFSDIDLLACISVPNNEIDPKKFSIYTYERLQKLWKEGNPFAWHLHLESRLIFSSDNSDFLASLGKPSRYSMARTDCTKFLALFSESYQSLAHSSNSGIFHLSCMFLAMRNFATCLSLARGHPVFARKSPLLIDQKLSLDEKLFNVFARARILSTRGYGPMISQDDIKKAEASAP